MKRKKVQVLAEEKKVFNKILEYNKYAGAGIIFRVAGGWVRDRLLGIECHDIDIAIDKASGAVFAKGFAEYIKSADKERVYGFHVIPYNHEKSKHLETASMRYKGYTIDFVALRTEEYTNTRIPVIRTGTPKEDAERRDLTINALFYNINTEEIEDYTEKGLYDIEHRIIRTPLAPSTTFFDDPLRILRVLRFSARLCFTIVSEIYAALHEPSIIQRLGKIISRERIGQEIKKMLSLPSYYIALIPILEYSINTVIFPHIEMHKIHKEQTIAYIEQKKEIEKEQLSMHPMKQVLQEEMMYVNIFSILHHAINTMHTKKISVSAHTIIEDLKWTRKERCIVERVESSLLFISQTAKNIFEGKEIEKGNNKGNNLDKNIAEENITQYKKWLIKVARKGKEILPLILSIYDIVQKVQRKAKSIKDLNYPLTPVDIPRIYADIEKYKYAEVWKIPLPISYTLISSSFSVQGPKARKYMEEALILSILNNTTDKKILLSLLEKHFRIRAKKESVDSNNEQKQ